MIPFLILIFSISLILLSILIANKTEYLTGWHIFAEIMIYVSCFVGFISLMIFPQYPESYKLYPVEYSVTKSNTHIAVATDYGTFESNKIQDLNDWSKNKTGYIKVKYNIFGIECQKHEFTTNNTID